jgi:fatty-acyl-CoA synthase
MKQALSRTLAPFKVPSRIWAVADYPTTQSANGAKVQRAKLRQMAQERIKEAA